MFMTQHHERQIRERLSVPLWPHAGRALNLKRFATYAAAEIPTLGVSRKKTVATSWLRRKLGIAKGRLPTEAA
jgi:hypothetical protein